MTETTTIAIDRVANSVVGVAVVAVASADGAVVTIAAGAEGGVSKEVDVLTDAEAAETGDSFHLVVSAAKEEEATAAAAVVSTIEGRHRRTDTTTTEDRDHPDLTTATTAANGQGHPDQGRPEKTGEGRPLVSQGHLVMTTVAATAGFRQGRQGLGNGLRHREADQGQGQEMAAGAKAAIGGEVRAGAARGRLTAAAAAPPQDE